MHKCCSHTIGLVRVRMHSHNLCHMLAAMHSTVTSTQQIKPEFEQFFRGNWPHHISSQPRSLLRFYHAILIQSRALPDPFSATVITSLVRARFEKSKNDPGQQPSQERLKQARKCLVLLQKANLGDLDALRKVAEITYGQRGRLRHTYLDRITNQLCEPGVESIPGRRRSRPPTVPDKLAALWTLQFGNNKKTVSLPVSAGGPQGKPLDKRREANLIWRHHTSLLKRTMPPIPLEQYQALVAVASGSATLNPSSVPKWRRKTREEMIGTATLKTTEVHSLNKRCRTLQRLYGRILARSPVLYQTVSGHWKARYAQAASSARES